MPRLAIIGAGPIGLEAALLARQLGHDVQVFEKGRIAENVLDWGHVRLFSPFGMNSSEWGRGAIVRTWGADALPRAEELLTGAEFAQRYLLPLSRLPELAGCIHAQCRIVSLSRRHFKKTNGIGAPARGHDPFQLLVEHTWIHTSSDDANTSPALDDEWDEEPDSSAEGRVISARIVVEDHHIEERIESADVVLDCSGTYPHHNWLGAGGMPCIGETAWLNANHYRLRPITPEEFANKITLVVGSGFSAATSVVALAELAKQAPHTKVLWFAKSQSGQGDPAGPMIRIPNDPLVERDHLATRANELASMGHISRASLPELKHHPVVWFPDVAIKSITPTQTCRDFDGFEVELDWPRTTGQGSSLPNPPCRLTVDRIIANVGDRPDRSIYEELHVHECYATQGPIKLAAKLLGETSSDCLVQASHGVDVLKNPEPNFFILGSKSYGRNSNFLLRVGLWQIRDVFACIGLSGVVG
jgi:pyridine nucleotide-disulfide oxidoreductase